MRRLIWINSVCNSAIVVFGALQVKVHKLWSHHDSNLYPIACKSIFEDSEHVRHKPECSAIEASMRLALWLYMLSRQQTTKVLIRLRICAG